MKKNVIIITCFLLMMNIGYSQNQKYPTNKEIIEVAKKGLNKQLELIKFDDVRHYGFDNENELVNIQLGTPYQLLTLEETFYNTQYDAGYDYIVKKQEWLVPLIVNDTIKAFLTVGFFGNELKTVGIGANILANKIFKCEKNNKVNLNNKQKSLFRVYSLNTDYLLAINSKSIKEFFPLQIIQNSNDRGKNKYSKDELFPIIKQNYLNKFKN